MKKVIKKFDDFVNESSNLNINMSLIERDLQNFIKKHPDYKTSWGQIQNDKSDKDTKPYNIYSYTQFVQKWKSCTDINKIKYALTRWFLHWCAKCDENILCGKYAIPNPDIYDRTWDIQFKGINNCPDIKFDVKSTRIPKELDEEYYVEHPIELIKWMYNKQSQESRKGFQNRLFIIHIPSIERSEAIVRTDFDKKREIIEKYYQSIENGDHLPYEIEIGPNRVISDVIFVD